MTDMLVEIEAERAGLLRSALDRQSRDLKSLGLRVELLEIRRSGEGERYESEAGAYFWLGEDLVDAIEFPIFRNGVVSLSLAETVAWLDEALADVVRRQLVRRP